ncbi:MAG: methyl-accepting chemotaxis protein [Motiliproteus sp.]|nr:methyl-accepting chemotaxis protein [Motiliproteus sp.]MCW9053689.1 methyl-accepting chemotaxis protein [Motiliproteus sp.]
MESSEALMQSNPPSPDLPQIEENTDQQLIETVQQLIHGNYMVDADTSTELGETIQELILKLRQSHSGDLDRVVKLSMCSNETNTSSARLLYRLQNVNQRAQSIAAAAEELQASVSQIQDHSRSVRSENNASTAMMDDVFLSLRASVSSFEEIRASVLENADKINEMGAFAKEIRDMADAIKGISFQTKLLALNASVEGARAGELGAGFRVVAEEMRTLSDKSSSATKKITSLVDTYEERMQSVTKALGVSLNNVDEGKVSIESVDNKMTEMKENIFRSSENISNITNAIQDQNSATEDVSQGIYEIAQNTSESVHSTDQIVDSMEELQSYIDAHILKISELTLPNKVIKLAQSDHVIWKKRLVSMICGKAGLQEKELADHHSCRLGQWYDQVTEQEIRYNSSFKDLLQPHAEVHRHGKQAVAYYNQGNIGEALKEIEAVEQSSVEVLRLLQELETAG